MRTIGPKDKPLAEFHNMLLTAVSPRPICFASTMDKNGNPNLSPFSFFNVFGSNPVTFIFSPARRVRDNTIKHTLENVLETGEVVINVVNYAMVQQMSLASCEYPKGVNEFEKSGFTALESQLVKPFRVKESPVQFECKVRDVIYTGEEGGAGNLIVCEMLLMHIADDVMTATGGIDQEKIDVVARAGYDYYVRASKALFEVPKPNRNLGMGVDELPETIRLSKVLTGNDLGILANEQHVPDADSIEVFKRMHKELQHIHNTYAREDVQFTKAIHQLAHQLCEANKPVDAWKVLLS
ncbi:MAG: flavin reductase family protein [Bacteroidia bacterium]|nr:flavin reductase family protein [Bacteroidia bacterium]